MVNDKDEIIDRLYNKKRDSLIEQFEKLKEKPKDFMITKISNSIYQKRDKSYFFYGKQYYKQDRELLI